MTPISFARFRFGLEGRKALNPTQGHKRQWVTKVGLKLHMTTSIFIMITTIIIIITTTYCQGSCKWERIHRKRATSSRARRRNLIWSSPLEDHLDNVDDLYFSNFLLDVVMDMVPIVVANKSITFILINMMLFMMIATKRADVQRRWIFEERNP